MRKTNGLAHRRFCPGPAQAIISYHGPDLQRHHAEPILLDPALRIAAVPVARFAEQARNTIGHDRPSATRDLPFRRSGRRPSPAVRCLHSA
jgi:hypothetical protein